MLITSIFLICIGWVLGVHLPWYYIAMLGLYGLWAISKNTNGLEGITETLIIVVFMSVMMLSGFIYGDVSFVDIGETMKYLFTGG